MLAIEFQVETFLTLIVVKWFVTTNKARLIRLPNALGQRNVANNPQTKLDFNHGFLGVRPYWFVRLPNASFIGKVTRTYLMSAFRAAGKSWSNANSCIRVLRSSGYRGWAAHAWC